MKTLHVFHHSTLHNGVERTACTLVKALKQLGVEPTAIVPAEGQATDFLDTNGIPRHIIPFHCCESCVWRAQLKFLAESNSAGLELEQLLDKGRFDLVHINTSHPLHAGLAAADKKIPTIWHIHAPFDIDYARYGPSIEPEGYAWMLEQLGSQFIGVSDDVRHSLAEKLPANRIHTVYNGIDAGELEERAAQRSINIRRKLSLPEDCRLVIGIGRISKQKNFASFARVAARIAEKAPNVFFIIAGPPEEREAIEELDAQIQADQSQGKIHLLGARQDVPQLIAQSDVFLSTAIYEGHPLAALESMALKTPVVAMACEGLRECIRHEIDGLLVEPGDERKAAEYILALLNDPSRAQALGIAGKRAVLERFSSIEYAKRFLEVAEKAAAFGPPPISKGGVQFVRGLLVQIGQARDKIKELENRKSIARRGLELIRAPFHKLFLS